MGWVFISHTVIGLGLVLTTLEIRDAEFIEFTGVMCSAVFSLSLSF
jgi:hypothetical protein